jgi:Fur family zinc uptake transcriptional regulator
MAASDENSAIFPAEDHDHRTCMAAVVADAERLCARRRARLTAGRRRVLEVVAANHAAIGAYAVMERLAAEGRRPAPVSVYRALDFLIAHGLVHRINSLNAYVACARPREAVGHAAKSRASCAHGAQFLICRGCGAVGELGSVAVGRALDVAASEVGFSITAPVVEAAGMCRNCRRDGSDRTPVASPAGPR